MTFFLAEQEHINIDTFHFVVGGMGVAICALAGYVFYLVNKIIEVTELASAVKDVLEDVKKVLE